MSGLPLRGAFARMLQYLTSMVALIIVSCMLKERYVSLLPFLALKELLKNDHIHVLHDLPKKYIYGYLISKLISSKGNNPEHDITKHLFTSDLR